MLSADLQTMLLFDLVLSMMLGPQAMNWMANSLMPEYEAAKADMEKDAEDVEEDEDTLIRF